jgi:Ca2+-binding RTX toxin-like protein
MTSAGGTFGYKLVADAGGSSIVGSSKADNLDGAAGVDTLTGGGGSDTINGGALADSITGGASADTFHLYDPATVDVVTDFTVSQTDLAGFDVSAFEALTNYTDLVQLDADSVGNTDAITVQSADLSSEYDIANAATDANLLILQGNYDDAAAVQVDIRANLKALAAFADEDALLLAYDDGTHSYLASLETGAAVLADADVAAAVVSNFAKLTNLADATTLTADSFINFVA